MTQPESDDGPCSHEYIEFLGDDTSRNRYSRCRDCRSILIHDGVTDWVIRPGRPLGSQDSG